MAKKNAPNSMVRLREDDLNSLLNLAAERGEPLPDTLSVVVKRGVAVMRATEGDELLVRDLVAAIRKEASGKGKGKRGPWA